MNQLFEAIKRVEREEKLAAHWDRLEIVHSPAGGMAIKIPIRGITKGNRQKIMDYLKENAEARIGQTISHETQAETGTGSPEHFLLIRQKVPIHSVQAAVEKIRQYGNVIQITKTDLNDYKPHLDFLNPALAENKIDGLPTAEQLKRMNREGLGKFSDEHEHKHN